MKRNRKQETVKKWFYSYTAVLLLPILFGCLIYLFSVRIISEKTRTLQSQNAEKDNSFLEQTFEGISGNAQNIMLNDGVTYFSERRGSKQDEAIRIKEVQDFIAGFCMANKAISSVALFYPKENLIITNTNCMSMAENTLIDGRMYLYKEPFASLLREIPYNQYYILNQSGGQLLYTLCEDGRRSFLEQKLVVVITVKQQFLQAQLSNPYSVLILKAKQLGAFAETEPSVLKYGKLELPEDFERQTAAEEASVPSAYKKDYYMEERRLPNSGILVRSIYSNQEIKREFQTIWLILAVYAVCCLAAGPYIIYRISKKNYTPVENLIELMESNGLQTGAENEFAAIHHNVLTLLKGMRDDRAALMKQQNFYEESQLYYLLKSTSGRARQITDQVADKLPHHGYVAVAFDAEDVKEVLKEKDSMGTKDLELLDFVISNVAQEFYAENFLFLHGKIENLYCFILNFPLEDETECSYLLLEKTNGICKFLAERFEFAIFANISTIKKSLEELPLAYQELTELAEFRDYIGSGSAVLRYDTFSDDEEVRRELYRITTIHKVWDMLKSRKDREAEAMIQEMRRHMGAAEWTEDEEGEEKSGEQEESGESGRNVKSAEQTIGKVEEYINTHYLDPQITVSSIAYLFGLNPSYLSRSFCQVMGRGMLEYLTGLRLEHAKKCMEAGESVTNASLHSGFYSCRPFIRAFREEMGVTPGEYYKKKRGKGKQGTQEPEALKRLGSGGG